MNRAGGQFAILSCCWISGWRKKKKNELWSINLFIHNYPSASLLLSGDASISQSCITHHLMAPIWPKLPGGASVSQVLSGVFFFHNTTLNPKRGVRKHLDDITDVKFQRSPRSLCEGQITKVGEERATRVIRISLFETDDLCCQVNILGSSLVWGIFQPWKGVETLKGGVKRAIELLWWG